jgi:hypothetical protein
MKELSLNILDIAENSLKAGAALTEILLYETDTTLKLVIKDNGSGMSKETVLAVTNPFYTTRTTRSVGLGIPLLKLAAEQTGGAFQIESKIADELDSSHGTTVTALFYKNHLDFTPLGDVVSTIQTLIQGHPDRDFLFIHEKDGKKVSIDTREIREVLEGVPLDTFEVLEWISDNLSEQYKEVEF